MLLTKFIASLIAAAALIAPGIPKRNPLAFQPVQNEPTPQDPAPATDPFGSFSEGTGLAGGFGMVAQPAFPQADPFAPFAPMDPWPTTAEGNPKVIGVTIGAVDAPLAKQLGIDADKALLIASVVDGLPAQKAGIEAFDVLIAVDGDPITGSDGLRKVLAKKNVGDSITLTIRRGCETKQVDVAVAEAEKQTAESDGFRSLWITEPGIVDKERNAFIEAQRAQAAAQEDLAKNRLDLAARASELAAARDHLNKRLQESGLAQAELLKERLALTDEQFAKLREDWLLTAERYRAGAQDQLSKAEDLLSEQQIELQRRNDQLLAERDRLGDALASQLQRLSDARTQLSEQLAGAYEAMKGDRLAQFKELQLADADREKLAKRLAEIDDRALSALRMARDRLDVPQVEIDEGTSAFFKDRYQPASEAERQAAEAMMREAQVAAKMRYDADLAQKGADDATNARLTTIEETLARIEAKIDAMSAKKRGSDN